MGEKGGREKSPEAEQHFEKSIRLCRSHVRRFISDLASVAGLVHFSQLEAPVEPDDGAEGERWQHAPSSAGSLLVGCCWSSRITIFASQRARRCFNLSRSSLVVSGSYLVWTDM